jgi:hypothetical protein
VLDALFEAGAFNYFQDTRDGSWDSPSLTSSRTGKGGSLGMATSSGAINTMSVASIASSSVTTYITGMLMDPGRVHRAGAVLAVVDLVADRTLVPKAHDNFGIYEFEWHFHSYYYCYGQYYCTDSIVMVSERVKWQFVNKSVDLSYEIRVSVR